MGEPRSLVCRGLCTPPSPGALHTVTAGCTGAGLGVGVAPLAGPGLPASAVGTGHPRAEGGGQCGACGRERPPPAVCVGLFLLLPAVPPREGPVGVSVRVHWGPHFKNSCRERS